MCKGICAKFSGFIFYLARSILRQLQQEIPMPKSQCCHGKHLQKANGLPTAERKYFVFN